MNALIEGQGQLIDRATNNKYELEKVKVELENVRMELLQAAKSGEIATTGFAKLTLKVSDLQDQVRSGFQEATRQLDRSEQTQHSRKF